MHPITLENIIPTSDLAVRILANYARLEGEKYRPDEVFTADQNGWPADWEGRLILALALYAQATRRKPAYLDEILELIPQHLNEKGYFGPVLPNGVSDEQQMAGHSWYLRALLECRTIGYRKQVDPLIRAVVRNLLLPSRGNYSRYPIDPATRWESPDWKLSQLQKKVSTHAETSDCGCAFIMLDGATAYYEEKRDPRIRELIYEMIARYRQLDFEGIHVQTHATLSALRGILRMYRIEKDETLLHLVKRIFTLYKTKAWTAAYGNYNWFGIPRWTEPCAIIDSYLLATQLWQITGETRWLNDAHHIYYNAMAHAQRATGAFGTDTCVGPAGKILAPVTYEVAWCCTMRGAEGLSSAARYSFFSGESSITIPFYHSCTATIATGKGSVQFRERTAFPSEGDVELRVEKSTIRRPIELRFFIPPNCGPKVGVTINGKRSACSVRGRLARISLVPRKGDSIRIRFAVKNVTVRTSLNGKGRAGSMAMHGPSILAVETDKERRTRDLSKLEYQGKGRYMLNGSSLRFRPLWDITKMTGRDSQLQVIF